MSRLLAIFVPVLVALAFAGNAFGSNSDSLTIDPDPGESLSGGVAASYSDADSTFGAHYDGVDAFVNVVRTDPVTNISDVWNLEFSAPPGQPLMPGTYTNIARAPFRAWGQAGVDITHHEGCNTVSGSFTVNSFTPGPINYQIGYYRVNVLDIDFSIQCGDPSFPTLRGHVHYEEPPDTTPPVFSPVDDSHIEAFDANGAVYYYWINAYDDRDGYVIPQCTPSSGSLFPIGTTTVSCTASDQAGNSSQFSFRVIVDTPFQLGLSLNAKGSASTKTGTATTRGAVSCNRSAGVWLTVSISQVVARRATISGSNVVYVPCTAPSSQWSADVTSSAGAFLSGKATATVNAQSCPYYCKYAESTKTITLTGS
jgi:hypothetical protein